MLLQLLWSTVRIRMKLFSFVFCIFKWPNYRTKFVFSFFFSVVVHLTATHSFRSGGTSSNHLEWWINEKLVAQVPVQIHKNMCFVSDLWIKISKKKEDDGIEPFSFERARLLFSVCWFSHRVTNAEELLTATKWS